MQFYVGVNELSTAVHFSHAFISINRLRRRQTAFEAQNWILDSGAFSEISNYGRYRHSVEKYGDDAALWWACGNLQAIVSQDWMCEPWIVEKTGLTVAEHQRLTIDRYVGLLKMDMPVYVMPVIQGFQPEEYSRHVRDYGSLLGLGAWVGVGSVCKRAGRPAEIVRVLSAILDVRPDLNLHGFGVKKTSLKDGGVRSMLHSADSMAWSFAARVEGRDCYDWKEAIRFRDEIEAVLEKPGSDPQMDMRF